MNLNERILHSRFRKGYFIQIALTVMGFLAGAVYFLAAADFKKFSPYISIFILIFGAIILYFLFLQYLIKIEIDGNGIRLKHLMKKNPYHITYDDIEKIDLETFQIENLNGPLTEGIPEIYIILKSGEKLVFSPSVYDNYLELSLRVLREYQHLHEKKLEQTAREILKNYIQNKLLN